MFEPCTYKLTAVSQLRNFGAQAFVPFPKLKKETLYFSFSKTKLVKLLAKIPNEKVLVAAKSQLTRLKGSCNIRVPTRLLPGGSSGCSRSNAVQLRRQHYLSNSSYFKPHQACSRTLCLHREHRARKHFFSDFAKAPLAEVPETRATPRQSWQVGTNEAALPNEAVLRWDLQLDCSSNGRVPVSQLWQFSLGSPRSEL